MSLLGGVSKNFKINDTLIDSTNRRIENNSIYDKDINKPYKFFNENENLTLGDRDPQMPYNKFNKKKTSVHFGQLKLLISEIEFFTYYWDHIKNPNPLILYIGAAPGTHIYILSKMFPKFEFHLYDKPNLPIVFDEIIKNNPQIIIHEKYFTDEDIEEWKLKKNVYLISDIRSLNYNTSGNDDKENENIAKNDMKMQEKWLKEINPVKALLKFRLPYNYQWLEEKEFEYTDGLLYLQQWAPQNSTECRLVPNYPYTTRKWNISVHESMMFYHNKITRQEEKFINIFTEENEHISTKLGLTNDYDSIATSYIITQYLIKFAVDPREEYCIKVLEKIMKEVNAGRSTLLDVRHNKKISEEDFLED